MSVSLDPVLVTGYQNDTLPSTRVHTREELEELKEAPTTLQIDGDVYISNSVRFRKLSIPEMEREEILVDTSNRTYTHYSDPTKNVRTQLIAFRDPDDPEEIRTLEIDKGTLKDLMQHFGSAESDFFFRPDGILRLNGDVEEYIAGWMQDIRTDRNYTKADADGNGFIEREEAKDLTIAYERRSSYDHLGRKMVHVQTGAEAGYQKMKDAPDAAYRLASDEEREAMEKQGYTPGRSVLMSQFTEYKNSVEEELKNTLKLDEDMDGRVTLQESLKGEFGEHFDTQIVQAAQKNLEDRILDNPELEKQDDVRHADLGLYEVFSEEELEAMMAAFKEQMAKVPELVPGTLIGDMPVSLMENPEKEAEKEAEEDPQKAFLLRQTEIALRQNPSTITTDGAATDSNSLFSKSSVTHLNITHLSYGSENITTTDGINGTREYFSMAYTAETTYFYEPSEADSERINNMILNYPDHVQYMMDQGVTYLQTTA